MFSGYEFALGLILGFILSVYAIRYFEKHYPTHGKPQASSVFGGVALPKGVRERKKPVAKDEFQEYQAELERLKEQRR